MPLRRVRERLPRYRAGERRVAGGSFTLFHRNAVSRPVRPIFAWQRKASGMPTMRPTNTAVGFWRRHVGTHGRLTVLTAYRERSTT